VPAIEPLRAVRTLRDGAALNRALAETARVHLLFAPLSLDG